MKYDEDYGTIDWTDNPDNEDEDLVALAVAMIAKTYRENHTEAEDLCRRITEQVVRLLHLAVQVDSYVTAHAVVVGVKHMLDELDAREAAIYALHHPESG